MMPDGTFLALKRDGPTLASNESNFLSVRLQRAARPVQSPDRGVRDSPLERHAVSLS